MDDVDGRVRIARPACLGDNLYDIVLPDVVAKEDPARPYWPSSPYGSPPDDGTTDSRNPSHDMVGDSHYWNVWHGEGDWTHYLKCESRFVSEFGFASPPALQTLIDCLDESDLGVDTPGMRWHDKTGRVMRPTSATSTCTTRSRTRQPTSSTTDSSIRPKP